MIREYLIPIAVCTAICCVILPLPPFVIDCLIAGNLVLSLVLLASALYVGEPLKLSTLPSLLLITTLMRLSLNVSTTRLILSKGSGGKIIEAAGTLMTGGNLTVGIVVFLIVTLVQFIVIAKGSERVAEVAARFTLDALPGRQMSVDADVRAGLIGFEEARAARKKLQVESGFYGALDGAMKFIKGDAIAGIVITTINIVAGLGIGMIAIGLSPVEALERYSRLSVGDGMISQIPALLNSLAAGLIVTRVVNETESSPSQEMISQLVQNPVVLASVGSLSCILALIPGLPFLPFCITGLIVLVCAASKLTAHSQATIEEQLQFVPQTPALLNVQFHPGLVLKLLAGVDLASHLESFRKRFYQTTGILLPAPSIQLDGAEESKIELGIRGFPIGEVEVEEATDLRAILDELYQRANEHVAELVDDTVTRGLLDTLDREAPELVSAVVPGLISVTQVSELLRMIVEEGLSIKNLVGILQAVAESAGKTNSDREILEHVRRALRREITARFKGPDGSLSAITLTPALDSAFAAVERQDTCLDPDHVELLFQAQCQQEGALILCSSAARRIIWDCLKARGADVVVLAYDEIIDTVEIRSIVQVDLLVELEVEQLCAA